MKIVNTRPYKAGLSLAKSIVELVNLIYQNDTAKKFLIGLQIGLLKEMERRGIKKEDYL